MFLIIFNWVKSISSKIKKITNEEIENCLNPCTFVKDNLSETERGYGGINYF